MFNKEFLKTLTILYVEDDTAIRTSLSNILNKVFKEVIICEDGQIGVDEYIKHSNTIEFDAIISDINMPNLNGLEMVKEIRNINSDIPVIMTTAHGEANYLMEAIKINVSGYSLKPVDTKDLLMSIQKFCEIKKNQKLIIQKEAELSEYMDLINTLSTITKVDMQDNITEANAFFQDISEYNEEELLNKNINDILHIDTANTTYKKMKESISHGMTWKGKLKLNTKQGEKFHLRTTSIPKKDHDTGLVIGYISIGFLADDEEEEKAHTMHQVKLNLMEQKQKVLSLSKEVKLLKQNQANPLHSQAAKNERILKSALKEEKRNNTELVKQVDYYEYELSTSKAKLQNILNAEKDKRQDLMAKVKEQSIELSTLRENLIAAQSMARKPRPKYVE
jgi:PAS domain S-box-containing protein